MSSLPVPSVPTAIPVTTDTVLGVHSGVVNRFLISDVISTAVKTASLAATSGATLVGTSSGLSVQTVLDSKAPLASPIFTGTVTIPTGASIAGFAPLASPTFTGVPAAPTATAGTNTTQLATTAFATTADNLKANIASPTFTGTVNGITAAMVGLGSVTNLPQVVLQRAYAELATATTLTSVIPADNTIPQNTEGTQIFSIAITPKSTTNRLRLRCVLNGGIAAIGNSITASFFKNGQANALYTSPGPYAATADDASLNVMEYEFVPATTSAVTLTVRAGPAVTGTVSLNAYAVSGAAYGGTWKCTFIVEEITP